jgi:ABC-type lipoprotein release transport system permease subunit
LVLILTAWLTDRRKKIGTLKAIGWQTRCNGSGPLENIFVSILSACLALIAAVVWIHVFNGFFVAQFFIGDSGIMPNFPVPARFMPVPAFISFLLAFTLTMTGSLYNTWRMAATPAAETMR